MVFKLTYIVCGLHKWLILIFLKTIEASSSQIIQLVAEGLCLMTGNDVITYFRSAANRTKCQLWVVFLYKCSTHFQKVCIFGKGDSSASFSLSAITHFCCLTPKMGPNGPTVICTLHRWLIFYCCSVQVAHASRCMGVHKRFWNT